MPNKPSPRMRRLEPHLTTQPYIPFAIDADLLGMDEAAPRSLIGPITEASQGMLYGPEGIGKTLLAMELGMGLASGTSRMHHADGTSAPQWPCPQPLPVLYVAGEMHNKELRQRLELGGKRQHGGRFKVLSNAMLWKASRPTMNIAQKQHRANLTVEVQAHGAKLLILDNLDTLTSGINENDKSAIEPINTWLQELRYAGVAVLQVHHQSYKGNPRGSTVRGTPLDYRIVLSPAQLSDSLLDVGKEAFFTVTFNKVRGDLGRIVRPFSMRLHAGNWTFTTPLEGKEWQLLDIMEATGEFSWQAIAAEMQIPRSTLYRIRGRLIDKGAWKWGRQKKRAKSQEEVL